MGMNKHFLMGSMKQAELYGLNTHETLNLLKTASRPYRNEQAAKVRAMDESVGANKYTRQNDPVQYVVNPFVQGPIREVKNRLVRRYHAAKQQHPIAANVLLGAGALGASGIRTSKTPIGVALSALLAGAGTGGILMLGGPRAQERARKYRSPEKKKKNDSKRSE